MPNMMVKYSIVIFLLFQFTDTKTEGDKCRILVLEGGGDKGAFQAGAIYGLVNKLPSEEVKYDFISGISIGSINAVMVSLHEIGKEKEAADVLLAEWRSITGGDYLYRNWPWGGVIRGFFYKTGLFDSTPAKENLQKIVGKYKGLKRGLILGTVDTETGDYVTYDNLSLKDNDRIVNGVVSSGAFPVVFPLHLFDNKYWMDGGCKRTIEISEPVHKCKERGFDNKDIIIDVIQCSLKTMANVNPEVLRPLSVLNRYLQILDYDNTMRSLDDAVHFYKDIEFRYVIGPTSKLPSNAIPLTFSPKEIEEMISLGIEEAEGSIHLGPGKKFQEKLDVFREERFSYHNKGPKRMKPVEKAKAKEESKKNLN